MGGATRGVNTAAVRGGVSASQVGRSAPLALHLLVLLLFPRHLGRKGCLIHIQPVGIGWPAFLNHEAGVGPLRLEAPRLEAPRDGTHRCVAASMQARRCDPRDHSHVAEQYERRLWTKAIAHVGLEALLEAEEQAEAAGLARRQ